MGDCMAKKKMIPDFSAEKPATLDNSPFYGIPLDSEQLAFANAIWNPDIDIVFCNAKAGTGKAQPKDTDIPTPTGWKKLGDIKVGDYVFDRHGKETLVSGVFEQGKQRAYKVVLRDGRSTICAGEHLWSYYPPSGVLQNKFVTETLNSMRQRSLRNERTRAATRYAIPLNSPVQYGSKNFAVDPYVVGVFLGDGCCTSRQLSLSSADEEIPNEVARLIGATPHKNSATNYTWTFWLSENSKDSLLAAGGRPDTKKWSTSFLFKDMPEVMCGCSEKRIPEIYKYGSVTQRYDLLQGLFDTDGCINRAGDKYHVTFSSTSKGLADDVVEVINSLGYCATIGENNRDGRKTQYEVRARVPNSDKANFFRLPRKRDLALMAMKCDNFHKYDRIQISEIVDLGYECDMVCIYVENDEHLYLTNDYIVTHNTTIAVGVANMLVQYGAFDGMIYIMSPYGEKTQGWLPGTITEKSSVYFEAFYQALVNCNVNPNTAINTDSMVNQKNGTGYITCITDTFLRGSNLDNAVVIIDEAQNYTLAQLQKVLTRIGKHAKVVVIGHDLQCDLANPSASGFIDYLHHFEGMERAAVCSLTTNYRSWISQHADEIRK